MHGSTKRGSKASSQRASCFLQFEGTVLVLVFITAMNGLWFFYLAGKQSKSEPMFGIEHSRELALASLQQSNVNVNNNKGNENVLFAFTIRDAHRMVPVEPPQGIHIYDYVDVYHSEQVGKKAQLYLDGHSVAQNPPCGAYSLECYRDKLLQILPHALNVSQAEYFFYMESDNTLCVPLQEIEELTLRHQKYFLGTGVGASGWLMQRQFVQDFIIEYERMKELNRVNEKKEQRNMPDMVASNILIKNQKWAVTNRYLVSHSIQNSKGANALTQVRPGNSKHLPRCLEPHRGKWTERWGQKIPGGADEFGWDYFDYQKCPDAEVYPCHDSDEVPLINPPMSDLDDTSTKPPIRRANGQTVPPVRVFSKDGKVRDLAGNVVG